MAPRCSPKLFHSVSARSSHNLSLSGISNAPLTTQTESLAPRTKRKEYVACHGTIKELSRWSGKSKIVSMRLDRRQSSVDRVGSSERGLRQGGQRRRSYPQDNTGTGARHVIHPRHSEVEIRLSGGVDVWKGDYGEEVVMLTPEEIVALETLLRGGLERRKKCMEWKAVQLEEDCSEELPGTRGERASWALPAGILQVVDAHSEMQVSERRDQGSLSMMHREWSGLPAGESTREAGDKGGARETTTNARVGVLSEEAVGASAATSPADFRAREGSSDGRKEEEEEREGTGMERWREPEVCRVGEAEGMGVVLHQGLFQEFWSRGRWLLGLLVLQSSSGVVLQSYQDLIREHLVITLFLTMLVGAGGNAGNQSAIKVIRELATGEVELSSTSLVACLKEQALVGVLLAAALASLGFVRVYATNGDLMNSIAIALSLFLIVLASVGIGTALPFALAWRGVDPANAGTSVQVIMDLVGVGITCSICNVVFNAPPSLPLHATLAALQESSAVSAAAGM